MRPTMNMFVIWILQNKAVEYVIEHNDRQLKEGFYNHSAQQRLASFEATCLYPECLQVATSLRSLKVTLYEKVTVLGVRFRSRGYECRESSPPVIAANSEIPVNPANKLVANWSDPSHYSSWCALKASPQYEFDLLQRNPPHVLYGKDAMANRVYQYGQLNAFLKLSMRVDKFVHGMCIASVTTRSYTDVDYIDRVYTDDGRSFVSNRGYIPISYIIPTHIALAAVGEKLTKKGHIVDVPINLLAHGSVEREFTLRRRDRNKIKYLMMINIDRSRGSCLKNYYDLHGRKAFRNLLSLGQQDQPNYLLKANEDN